MDRNLPSSSVHGDCPESGQSGQGTNTGVGSSGKPFPSSGDLPNPGIKSMSPALQVDSLPSEPPGKPENTGVGSRGTSLPGNRTGVSCIADGFFTS